MTNSETVAATPTISVASSASLATTIIRPKVIPSADDVPIRKPIFIKPSESSSQTSTSGSSSKPLITATKPAALSSTFDPISHIVEQSPNSSFRPFISATGTSAASSRSASSRSPPVDASKPGPLPGKIITRENLVLTSQGITAKPNKPIVPPKPKDLLQKKTQQNTSTDTKRAPDETKRKEEEEKLLAPLESILNDADDLSNFLSQGAPRKQRESSVEKRECPGRRKHR